MRQSKQGQAAASQKEKKAPLPAGKAMVRSVPSGDQICIQALGKQADKEEALCYLAYVNVPRIGNPNRNEEPLAFEARELIRERLIGRKIDYVTEYMAGNKKAIKISIEGEDIS